MANFEFLSSRDLTEHCNKIVTQSNHKIKHNVLMNCYSKLANYPTLNLYKSFLDEKPNQLPPSVLKPFFEGALSNGNSMLIDFVNTLVKAELFSVAINIGEVPSDISLTQEQAISALTSSKKDECLMVLYKDKGMEYLEYFQIRIINCEYHISCDERSSEYVEGHIVRTPSSALNKLKAMRIEIEQLLSR